MPTSRALNLTTEKEIVGGYEFEPIQGYPMLNWMGKRPLRSTQYYPAQVKEVYGPEVNGWRNKVYWGDNLQVMSHLLKEYRGKLSLVYIDPPFDSKADYKKRIQLRGKEIGNDQSAFEEKQYTDIWSNDDYLQFMYERIILIRELLSDQGSLYLHCDWHQSHYLRCIMDEVFGKENFVNEIIWKRANTVKGNVGQGSKFWGANTDTIFFYRKSDQYVFNVQYKEYTRDYIDDFYKYYEPDTGRRYRLISMTAPGGNDKGNPKYEVMGVTRHWRYSREKMNDLIERGLVVQTKKGNVPQRKLYLDEGQGVAIQTLWDDIPGLSAVSSERNGYPTQKPEELLRRIIAASSNPDDIVFDCFMGSGTTQAVSVELGRRFIGADINFGAVQTTTKRLVRLVENYSLEQQMFESDEVKYLGFEVYNVNHYDVFRNPVQAKELLVEALEIQPLASTAAGVYDGEKDGRMVKIMPINRLATRVDLNELIVGFDYKAFERRQAEQPNRPVEKLLLVCMGHEPDLAAHLKAELHPFKIDVEVVDVLRDESRLEFRRTSEALLTVKRGNLIVERFYPMNLLQKLSLMKEDIGDWRELAESIMIDWNYDGAVMTPTVMDLPERNELVRGSYSIPDSAGTIRVKITDLLSESWEGEIQHG